MAIKLYKGKTPLLSQPRLGGSKMGRAYVGGQLAYGAAPEGPSIIMADLDQWLQVETGTSAGFLADSSGNGRNATNQSGGTFTYNTGTEVWDIASTTDGQAINTNYQPTWTSAFSFDMWVNLTSTDSNNACSLLGNRVSAGTDFFIFSANPGNGKIEMYWIDGGSEYAISPTPPSSYFDSSWHHVAFTRSSGGTGTLFVDGSSIGSTSVAGNPSNANTLSLMGKYLNNRWFTAAKLGSYRVYSADIGSAGVSQNYDAEKAHYGL